MTRKGAKVFFFYDSGKLMLKILAMEEFLESIYFYDSGNPIIMKEDLFPEPLYTPIAF